MAKSTAADAWFVSAGSKDVLDWFATQKVPVFCFAGVRHDIPLAGTGPDKVPPFVVATRHLLELGHSKISFLCRKQLRQPQRSKAIQAFLDELEGAGIDTGPFNLPDWAESGEGFSDCLESLFSFMRDFIIWFVKAYEFRKTFPLSAQILIRTLLGVDPRLPTSTGITI
jgi:DNA-binding LacI/PurR family transcriptional regulator